MSKALFVYEQATGAVMFGFGRKKKTRAAEVFTISVPSFNYVPRPAIEQRLRDEVERHDSIICISAPSKSGKSVLIRKTIPSLPAFTGRVDLQEGELWLHLCRVLSIPLEVRRGTTSQRTAKAEKVGLGVSVADGTSEEVRYERDPRAAFVAFVKQKGGAVIDDFHYFSPAVQKALLQTFKELLLEGKTALVIVVTHYGQDQPALAERDVTGRVKYLRLPEWTNVELKDILVSGFKQLNVVVSDEACQSLVDHSFGSPLIVQELGAAACRHNQLREREKRPKEIAIPGGHELVSSAVREGSIAGDAATFMELIVGRTPTRERVPYTIEGQSGDVYFLIFYALKHLDLNKGVSYDSVMAWLRARIATPPQGSQIDSALKGLRKSSLELVAKAQKEGRSREQAIDFQEGTRTILITDPFLKIYIKHADWETDYRERLGRAG